MLFAARCLPDNANGLTDEQCLQALQTRLGRDFDVWNTTSGESVQSTTNVAATWPTTFENDCVAAGKKVYNQLHFNQSAGSGGASDLTWPDLLNSGRALHSAAVSQMQAFAQRRLTMPAQCLYQCFHHEPEDDAKGNGFGAGQPWLDATATYNGITGITSTTTDAAIAAGHVINCAGGGGLPASRALCDAQTGAAFTYTLSGSALTVGTVLIAGAVNSGDTLQQAWTQDLKAQTYDAAAPAAAAALFAAAQKQAWAIWEAEGLTRGGSSPLIARVLNFMSGSWENGHFGGGSVWAGAVDPNVFDIVSSDAYVQPGNGDNLHIGTIGTPGSNLATSLAWAISHGKKWAVGEHGVAPVVGHGAVTDPQSKAYYFRHLLLPYLLDQAPHVEFFTFQGNTEVGIAATVQSGGTYTGPVNIPLTSTPAGASGGGTAHFPNSSAYVIYDSVSGANLHLPAGSSVTVATNDPVTLWQGRHSYGDWDDANQSDCTAALSAIVTNTDLQNPGGMVMNLFPYYKQNALNPAAADHVDYVADNIKVALISGYTYTAANKYLADAVTSGATIIARSGNIGTKTDVNGTAGAANETITAVAAGHTITGILVYKDTGSDATSPLVAHIDQDQSAVALSLATNGSDITVSWDASGIYDI
jgi:hypothetical protein